jgi:uncharacterized protein YecT (DUF1311 family)
MKNNHKLLARILLIGFLLILTACGNSEEKLSASPDVKSTENTSEDQNVDNTSSDTTEKENAEPNVKEETPRKDETPSTNDTNSLKAEYLKKLNDKKKEMEEMRNHPIDDTTFALKKVEGDLYDIWDGLLNEIYGVLKQQLPSEEMDQLRKEQREWIKYRDANAKEASLKYEGGTMEQLEYVAVVNNLTKERCFELVEQYMR